jgi:penicillin-binding protein 1A
VRKFLIVCALFLVLVTLSAMAAGGYVWYIWTSNLPYIGSLKDYRPPIITEFYSEEGEVIGRLWEEKRIVMPLEKIPPQVRNAFIAAEDRRFFDHQGLDFMGILRAFVKNMTAGRIEQGGSTITQQVTKSLLLKSSEKTYKRKVREATLSIQLEKVFSKNEILFLYLNQIYLGHGAYGVEAAARTYFDKSVADLTLAEAALIAGLPQAPGRYSPIVNFDSAKARQRYVLERMAQDGYITQAQAAEADKEELVFRQGYENTFQKGGYFSEHVRRYLVDKYGQDLVNRGGLKVFTSMSLKMQYAATDALKKGLIELDRREGYRGPIKHLGEREVREFKEAKIKAGVKARPGDVLEAIVEDVDEKAGEVKVWAGGGMGRIPFEDLKWARPPDPDTPYYAAKPPRPGAILKKGDLILVKAEEAASEPYLWRMSLQQSPLVQGAVICMEPNTGEVKAMLGGMDFGQSQFNRAIQSRRQPGSAFKPIIFAAALDKGMTPATVVLDAPYIGKPQADEEPWKPKNYKDKFGGPTILRNALAQSKNVITVKILKEIGVDYVVSYAKRLGIETEIAPELSLALGSSGLSLLELTNAYAAFAGSGMLPRPIFIKRVEDRDGRVLEENRPELSRAIPADTAYVLTEMLRAAVQEGTGWRVKALKRPAAGKTGTTNDLRDAWFIGYTPELLAGVWVGYDDQRPMGVTETGSRAASPIWLYFMSDVLEGTPVTDFKAPEGVVFARIDAESGLLAGPHTRKSIFQAFKAGTEPKQYAPEPYSPKSVDFQQYDMDHGG